MRRTCEVLTALCLLTFLVTLCGCGGGGGSRIDAAAKGKPGGGPPPPGTMYFASNHQMWTMDSDGSAKASLPVPPGEPSRELHAGQRWFLRDDGQELRLYDEAGNLTVLIPSTQLDVRDCPRWTRGDSVLSFAALAVDGTVGGIYAADVDWTSSPPSISAPALVVQSDIILGEQPGERYLAIEDHDWSPDGTQIVYADTHAGDGLKIAHWTGVPDLATSGTALPSTVGGYDPNWSPDGDTIAYRSHPDIYTVSPDGTGNVKILEGRYYGSGHPINVTKEIAFADPAWSPDSAHLACTRWIFDLKMLSRTQDVYRANADGSDLVNLTKDTGEYAAAVAWLP